jgi:5-dehydro-2-deoxygluconokinase
LKVAALTAVGEDRVGDFVMRFLQEEGVDTRYIPRKQGTRTGLALLGIEPPDKFPLVFYRENPADIHITIDDVLSAPAHNSRAVLLSGTALSRGSCRDATLFAGEYARGYGAMLFMDLDLRPDQWTHPRAYGVNIRAILPSLDIVIGTEEEFFAALSVSEQKSPGSPLSEAMRQELNSLLSMHLARANTIKAFVVKQGAHGVTVYLKSGERVEAQGFPVEVLNTVGAGDAFASGFIYGTLQGWDWFRCARMANACGALVVTRHGCAKAMPTLDEITQAVSSQGGF